MKGLSNDDVYKKLLERLEISIVWLNEIVNCERVDSEYYRKMSRNYQEKITSAEYKTLEEIAEFLIGPFGSAFNTENYVENGEYRYVRGKDVKPFVLADNDNRYVPKEDYYRLMKYALYEKDILVSVVGTLGNACIVTRNDLPAIFSCKSTVIRSRDVNPYFLLAYLNCKHGKQLLVRNERGANQKGLNLPDIQRLLVPIFSSAFQEKISDMVRLAYDKIARSEGEYVEAENLLLCKLSLADYTPSKNQVSVRGFREIVQVGRIDAEYYQPKYDDLFMCLEKLPTKLLGEIVDTMKSIEPGSVYYGDEGVPFIRVSDVSTMGIDTPSIRIPRNIVPSIETLYPKRDTILFSKDGSVGIAYKMEEDMEAVTSGALIHFRIKNPADILPDYLTLVLNSNIVQLQAERDASGAIIQHWKPSDIENVVIPVLPLNLQENISNKVRQSFALRRQAEKLLNLAMKAVEIAVEKDESVANGYISDNMK